MPTPAGFKPRPTRADDFPMTQTAPGWYHDGVTPGAVRWFDGTTWTEHVAPVAAPAAPAYVGYAPPPSGSRAGPDRVEHWLLPVGRSWQSVLAGYVGLLALALWALGPVAVALGWWALVRARSGGHGSGRAVFAIVTGLVGCVLGLWFLVTQV